MKWMVDCGPLGQLASYHDDAWKWPAAALHVTRAVEREALASNSPFNQRLLAMATVDGEQCIAVHDIPFPSAAATMFATHLRPSDESAKRNVGEDETIAFCAAMDTKTIFVTADKTAAFVALSELGRVVSRRRSIFGPTSATPSWSHQPCLTSYVSAASSNWVCCPAGRGDCDRDDHAMLRGNSYSRSWAVIAGVPSNLRGSETFGYGVAEGGGEGGGVSREGTTAVGCHSGMPPLS